MKPQFGADALRYSAIVLVGLYFVASALALLAIKPLRKDWVEEPAA